MGPTYWFIRGEEVKTPSPPVFKETRAEVHASVVDEVTGTHIPPGMEVRDRFGRIRDARSTRDELNYNESAPPPNLALLDVSVGIEADEIDDLPEPGFGP